jgi:hypothetical protein
MPTGMPRVMMSNDLTVQIQLLKEIGGSKGVAVLSRLSVDCAEKHMKVRETVTQSICLTEENNGMMDWRVPMNNGRRRRVIRGDGIARKGGSDRARATGTPETMVEADLVARLHLSLDFGRLALARRLSSVHHDHPTIKTAISASNKIWYTAFSSMAATSCTIKQLSFIFLLTLSRWLHIIIIILFLCLLLY